MTPASGQIVMKENALSHRVRKAVYDHFRHFEDDAPAGGYETFIRCAERPLLQLVLERAQGNLALAAGCWE